MLFSTVTLVASLSALASVSAKPLGPRDNNKDAGAGTGNGNGNGNGNAKGIGNGNGGGAGGDTVHAQVIIMGGGISGISTARTLMTEYNITDIILIEARDELGGRAHTETLHNSITGDDIIVEKGCNWIQGPGKEPILALAQKWGLQTTPTNYSSTAWFEGLGIEADGQRGHFLDADEQEAFMASYDTFIENAPGYSGTCDEGRRRKGSKGSRQTGARTTR